MVAKDPRKVAIGAKIREVRERANVSRADLALAAGVSIRAIVQWELGEREPSWGNILALGKALGVPCTAFEAEGEASGSAAVPRKPDRPRKDPEEPAPQKAARRRT
jgi:transcriptional regulator with XRE-family HTH domain